MEENRIQWLGGQNFEVMYDYSATGCAASYAQASYALDTFQVDALVIHDLDQGYHGKKFAYHVNSGKWTILPL